jgi:aspartokinase
METSPHPPESARQALDAADVLVTKIGGENAADLAANAAIADHRRATGKKQILAISALRSSDPRYSAYADEAAADRDKFGAVKPGFNATSHLIEMARRLQSGDLRSAESILERLRGFTREIVEANVGDDPSFERPTALARLSAVIDRKVNALLAQLRNAQAGDVIALEKDWLLRTNLGYVSLTGFGEDLAQAIYREYFQLRGLRAAEIRTDGLASVVFGDDPRSVLESERDVRGAVDTIRAKVRHQVDCLLPARDILVAGGYVPVLGGQRGYSDKTGALLAQAVSESGHRVAYLIEKQEPIRSADPRAVSGTRVVERMTPELALEAFGSVHGADGGAIHPEALAMLAHSGIDTFVLNPSDESRGITRIAPFDPPPTGAEIVAARPMPVSLQIRSTKMYGRPGFLETLTKWFSDRGISIDQVATTEVTVSFTFTNGGVGAERIGEFEAFLRQSIADDDLRLEAQRDRALLFCLGNNMDGLAPLARAVSALEGARIPVHSLQRSTREVITLIVDGDRARDGLRALHEGCVEVD